MNPDQIQARAMHDMLVKICEKLGIEVDSEVAIMAKNNAAAEKRYEKILNGELSQDGEELAPKSGRRVSQAPEPELEDETPEEDTTEDGEDGEEPSPETPSAPVTPKVPAAPRATATRKPVGRAKK